jgi:hypothetical protein
MLAGKGKRIDLIFDDDCPHVEEARGLLRSILDEAHLPHTWLEWSRQSPDTPEPLRRYASPTILIDGVDVVPDEGDPPPTGYTPCCRLYPDARGRFVGVPPRHDVLRALTDRA